MMPASSAGSPDSSLSGGRLSLGGGSVDGVPGFGMPVTEPAAASGFGRLSSAVCCCAVALVFLPHAATSKQPEKIAMAMW